MLPVAEHRCACETMVRLRDMLLCSGSEVRFGADGTPLENASWCKDVLLALSCAGVAVERRMGLAHEGDEAGSLRRTSALLLALLVLAMGPVADEEGEEEDKTIEPRKAYRDARRMQLEQDVHAYENGAVRDAIDGAATVARDSGWKAACRPSPAQICAAVLHLLRHYSVRTDVGELERWAPLFFRCSGASIARDFLDSLGTGDFVSMAVANALEPECRAERLRHVVSAAESEAGQTCLRDLQLSFDLPRNVIGVRRAILLPREVNALITKKHPEVLNAAHESALRGSEWEWAHSEKAVVRSCALLAGLAVLLNRGDLRKDDAFSGRVSLPFLEVLPSEGTRLTLLEDTGEWIAFTSCEPNVLVRRVGFEGLCDCVIALTARERF
jgi:hypothetical protein